MPCWYSRDSVAQQRVHVRGTFVPGPGRTITMVFIEGVPRAVYYWNEDGTLNYGQLLIPSLRLDDETYLESVLAEIPTAGNPKGW